MSFLWQRATYAAAYIRSFGFISGLFFLYTIEHRLPKKSDRVRELNLPGYGAPVYLRETIADHATFKQCLVKQQYDFRMFPQAKRLMDQYNTMLAKSQRPLIIDCGGNIGLASLWFARAFPEARIVVVEPDDANFELLLRNTAILGERIAHLKGGIWNTPAKLKITNPDAGAAAFRVEELDWESEGLRAYTIPEICEMEGVSNPFIVKLDIEGAQSSLFRSNTDWVVNTHLITLELDDWLLPWQGTSRRFFSCISKYPFEYLFREESIFCFRDFNAGNDVT